MTLKDDSGFYSVVIPVLMCRWSCCCSECNDHLPPLITAVNADLTPANVLTPSCNHPKITRASAGVMSSAAEIILRKSLLSQSASAGVSWPAGLTHETV